MIFTNTPASRALAMCVLPLAPVYRGGDSDSRTENKTEVRDMRVVGGENSSNVSLNAGDNSATNVILTDHGAVTAGLALGTQAIDAVVKNGEGLQQTTGTLYSGALAFAKDANARATDAVNAAGNQVAGAYSRVASDLATAFTDSKAPDKSILIVGGVVVLGLALVMVSAAKKG